MKRAFYFLTTLCLVMSSITAWGEAINENQARAIAAEFMASKAMPSANLQVVYKAPRLGESTATTHASYYVFNSELKDHGYVIVAGDDRAPAVLAYSDRGNFNSNDVPEAMMELLDGYTAQIAELENGAEKAPLLTAGSAIRPMVPTNWAQGNPYNILLPILSTGKHVVAGCVATALAQVMYYWQWPARPTQTIPTYISTDLGITMPALEPVDFNWSAMQTTYLSNDTASVNALAAATLTLYCAQSVQMNFKTSSSSATTAIIPLAISNYFGYKPSAHTLRRVNYTTQGWADALYAELAAGRPVIYSASKASSGHAFVCDGYDGNGMFHINWGWNGQSNGYFLLNVLNPDLQGTGSASGAYGYIYRQAAIVGIEPGSDGSSVFELTSNNVELIDKTTTREATNFPFHAVVSGQFYNMTSQVIAVRLGWGLFNENGEMIERLYSSYNTALRPGSYINHDSKTLSFGEDIASGTYRIMPMFSEYGMDNWRPCVGADLNYIEVTINGNNCSITGHGTAAERDYTLNDIIIEGNMHNGRPVSINVNLTNNGESLNQMMYMFVNGEFTSAGYVSLNKGETGDIPFRFVPAEAGTYTLTFSWNDDGSNPFATRTVSINAMPAANLGIDIEVLNVTSDNPRTITSRQFALKATITNNGTTTYDEDILARLCKRTNGTSGTAVQVQTKHLTLAPGETTTVDFALDNLIDGWYYFVWISCYSEGTMVNVEGTSSYLITFPEEPDFMLGDVNGDKKVDIDDVTALIDKVLGKNIEIDTLAADMDQNSKVDIDDVTALISRVLTGR